MNELLADQRRRAVIDSSARSLWHDERGQFGASGERQADPFDSKGLDNLEPGTRLVWSPAWLVLSPSVASARLGGGKRNGCRHGTSGQRGRHPGGDRRVRRC